MNRLMLTNTMTGQKESIVPLVDNKITMYVCGVTPYDASHVGHGRCYVTFDLLVRILRSIMGYHVDYCRNFTDIDDKILTKAHHELGDRFRYQLISERYITMFHEDMEHLGCTTPTYEPRVTQNMPAIIAFVEGLINRGHAYVVGGDVYYHVRSFSEYGALSGRNIDDLKSGARVAIDTDKRDPLDFALWKSEPEGAFWKSPWGWGRPGWHIECSALVEKFLGTTIDIHGGGMDLIFPHHENEIAQSEGRFDKQFARTWVHNAFVRIDKEKMSKSLGNFFTLRQIFEKVNPMVLRYYILTHHYRSPLDFTWEDLEAAGRSYARLCKMFVEAGDAPARTRTAGPGPEVQKLSEPPRGSAGTQVQEHCSWRVQGGAMPLIVSRMTDFLCDDLNTPGMLGVVFEHSKEIAADDGLRRQVKALLQDVLGLPLVLIEEAAVAITPAIQLLLDERVAARERKDWKRSDELRDELRTMGVDVQDKKL